MPHPTPSKTVQWGEADVDNTTSHLESRDIEMQENSPPRIAGNKRAAANSPAITPPGAIVPDTNRTENEAVSTELKREFGR
jgi:hypothetical protein